MVRQLGWSAILLWGTIVVAMTVVMVWVFTRTGGSLLIAWLFHLAANVTTVYIPLSPEVVGSLGPVVVEAALFGLLAAAVVVLTLRRPAARLARVAT